MKDFFSKCDQIRLKTSDLAAFTEEILNRKLYFLYSVSLHSPLTGLPKYLIFCLQTKKFQFRVQLHIHQDHIQLKLLMQAKQCTKKYESQTARKDKVKIKGKAVVQRRDNLNKKATEVAKQKSEQQKRHITKQDQSKTQGRKLHNRHQKR